MSDDRFAPVSVLIQLVTLALGACGAAAEKIVPPDVAAPGLLPALVAIISLGVLIFLWMQPKSQPREERLRKWRSAARTMGIVTVVLAGSYVAALMGLTFRYEPPTISNDVVDTSDTTSTQPPKAGSGDSRESEEGVYVRGIWLTQEVKTRIARWEAQPENQGKKLSVNELISGKGGVAKSRGKGGSGGKVWSRGSIMAARAILAVNYLALVVALVAAMFCVTEAFAVDRKMPPAT